MIRRAWRGIVRVLGSGTLAIWLLIIVGVWSAAATFIPQGDASTPKVAEWAATHRTIEPVIRAIGLHGAFGAFVFIACVLVLALSTGLCAWQRTKTAIGRARTLRKAAVADGESVRESHDLEISCDRRLSGPEVMAMTSETLERLGIRTKRRDDLVAAVSPRWAVWGSPVFHWALLALIAAVLAGGLTRSEGLMGIAVGQTKADAPASYGVLHSGPLRDWRLVHRSIRVDAFDPAFTSGGIDRGPTPTVSVLDGAGRVVRTQRVYPNMTLKTGSLTIYPNDHGLSAIVAVTNSDGAETGHAVQFIDFSQTATGGTVPAGNLVVSDAAGNPEAKVFCTVPLAGTPGKFDERLPEKPTVRVMVTSLDGRPLLDRVVDIGEDVALPAGGSLEVADLRYYARLSVVDDRTVPLLYAGLIAAMVGLTARVAARQQIVLASVMEGPEGVRLAATVRLWHNASTTRGELEGELARTLGHLEEGSIS